MIDANQSLSECFSGKDIKPFSIEWLRLQRGMDDPFIQLLQSRPNSTTIHPNRDIDYILTRGINIVNITTLSSNMPATSDHLGIVFDIDVASYFSSLYSNICSPNPRMLTSGNRRSVDTYTKFVLEQVKKHKLEERLQSLADKASVPSSVFTADDVLALNIIDDQLTSFLLAGEKKCARKHGQRQYWSPKQKEIARTFSYWRQKAMMEAKKLINWEHLNNLRYYTSISDHDHLSLDPVLIHNHKKAARAKWRACKKRSGQIRMRFLSERAEFMAMKMHTSEEKALRAILQSEASRHTFQKMHGWKGLTISNKYVPGCMGCCNPTLPSTATSKWN
jgi:hypothetical protein